LHRHTNLVIGWARELLGAILSPVKTVAIDPMRTQDV
jgi:hypothetical protein